MCRHWYRHDKVSAISGISVSPERKHLGLYCLLFDDNIHQEEVAQFLRLLLRHLRGPLIVLLDNGSVHRGEPLDLPGNASPGCTLNRFPPTPRNSTQTKPCGAISRTPWPTAGLTTKNNSSMN